VFYKYSQPPSMSSVCLANSPLEIDSSISEMQETPGRRKDPRVGWLVGWLGESPTPIYPMLLPPSFPFRLPFTCSICITKSSWQPVSWLSGYEPGFRITEATTITAKTLAFICSPKCCTNHLNYTIEFCGNCYLKRELWSLPREFQLHS